MTDVGPFDQDCPGSKVPRGLKLAALAGSQGGVVGRRQLVDLGLTRGAIDHWIDTGRLHKLHLGAYAVGHSDLGIRGRWFAAVLASGPGAVLSHRSAAACWDLRPIPASAIEVTALGRSRHRRGDMHIHRPRRMAEEDRTVRDGVPVTTVSRTLLDLAEVVNASQVSRALEQAERLRLFHLDEMEDLLERSRGRRGLRPLRRVLAHYRDPAPTRSELERRFLGLCSRASLPAPSVNLWVEGFEVDAVWPDARLIVELDGYEYHRTRGAFERDRARDAALQIAGYRVLRLTHRRVMQEPAAVVETVRSMLKG